MKHFSNQLIYIGLSVIFGSITFGYSQSTHQRKFEQLGTALPSPNSYRTASGAPGIDYWQQKADYKISVELDDENQRITGKASVTYTNNSPDNLNYLWVQLDQNVRDDNADSYTTKQSQLLDSLPAKWISQIVGKYNYEGGYQIHKVTDSQGKNLSFTVVKTMMRINITELLKAGEKFTFGIEWSYNIYDRMVIDGRGGYEYFPDDDNYLYTIAQWYPRMVLYSDFGGWQNKQFLGKGEFARY